MDKIEKIRQEIERLIEMNKTKNGFPAGTICAVRIEAYERLLTFLDTLSEEPDKSLEEAAEEYSKRVSDGHNYRDLTCGFIAGAEWQASRMPMPEDTVLFNKGVAEGRRLEREDMLKDAVEGYVNYYEDSGGILMAEAQVGCPYHNGDKVRIVVLKAEE